MRFETKAERRRARTPEIIEKGQIYSLREFLRRGDFGDATWRLIRRKIPLRKVGTRIFILGDDWHRYLESIEAEPLDGA